MGRSLLRVDASGGDMGHVRMKKGKLIDIIKANRIKHKKDFVVATKNYRTALVGILREKLAAAKAGKDVEHNIQLTEPFDRTADYDKTIKMLELNLERVLTLTATEFSQYVQDEWAWKHQFDASNSYLGSTAMTYSSSS